MQLDNDVVNNYFILVRKKGQICSGTWDSDFLRVGRSSSNHNGKRKGNYFHHPNHMSLRAEPKK